LQTSKIIYSYIYFKSIMSSFLIKQVSSNASRASSLLAHTAKNQASKSALFSTLNAKTGPNVVIVDGVRLPFAMASTIYEDEMAVDLQRLAFKGLIDKTAIEKKDIDYVISGTVIQEVRTSNIAREAAINAGIPNSVGGHTVSMACISSNAAICAAADKIRTGHASAVLAGGTETFSDVPIRLTRPLRQKLITLPKAMKKGGGALGAVRHLLGLQMKDVFALETPAIANYTTGEVMGVSSDRLSAKFGVAREDQDVYTVRSHTLAAKAHLDG
jgi:acetyl-CoA acyltransferase